VTAAVATLGVVLVAAIVEMVVAAAKGEVLAAVPAEVVAAMVAAAKGEVMVEVVEVMAASVAAADKGAIPQLLNVCRTRSPAGQRASRLATVVACAAASPPLA
jgi:hypothetical protein